MKALHVIITVTFCIAAVCSSGQQISAEVGRVSTTFHYRDSKGNASLLLNPETHFNYGVGYRQSIKRNIHYGGSLMFNEFGSNGVDSFRIHELAWRVKYAGFEGRFDWDFIKTNSFSLFIRAAAGYHFFIGGTQRIDKETINLARVEQFNKPLWFITPSAGATYCLSEKAAFVLSYRYGYGAAHGSDEPASEQLHFTTNTVNIGLLWSLTNCKYCKDINY